MLKKIALCIVTLALFALPGFACEWWCGHPVLAPCSYCYGDVCVDYQCSGTGDVSVMSEEEFLATLAAPTVK